MTRFNYSLDDDPTSEIGLRMPLTPDEVSYYSRCFFFIARKCDYIPEKNANDMAGIEVQFLKDNRLSEKQMKYIRDIYERYCI